MAIFLSALLLQNVIPGPEMLKNDLPLTFTLLWGMALANIIGGILCFFLAGYFNLTRLISIAPRYIVPAVMALIFVGAFVEADRIGDLVIAFVFTVIGVLMKKLGYNRGALLLGFVLGRYFENYFWLSLQTRGPLFFLQPACLVIMAITVSLYVYSPIMNFMGRGRKQEVSV